MNDIKHGKSNSSILTRISNLAASLCSKSAGTNFVVLVVLLFYYLPGFAGEVHIG